MHVAGLPLPEVVFTTHPQVGLALVEDKVSQAYGYNDGKSWIAVEGEGQYLRWIQPMESDQSKQVEYDMDEQDQAWLDLVNSDRRNIGLEPVSYEIFEILIDKLEKEWFDLVKRMPKKEVIAAVDDGKCAICDDGECENSNAIVFCDGCNLAVHQDCYGVPYIPEGQWLCRKCTVSPDKPVSCVLCPNSYGAFKQTTTAQWAHLLCAIWIPDTGVSNTIYMEPVDGIENISKNRWKLNCYLCRKRMGACIQCANRNCFTAFHVTCARERGLELKMKAGVDRGELNAFCDKHSHGGMGNFQSDEPFKRSHKRLSEQSPAERGYRDPAQPFMLRPPVQKSSKSARAYKKSYSSGPPVIPAFIFNRLVEYIVKIKIEKKSLFVGMICRYWSLKREARRGAPLLKRLHLEPWTASASSRHQNDYQKALKLEHMQWLKKDLEQVRRVVELTKQREEKKLARVHLLKKVIDDFVFSKDSIMRGVLEQIILLDINGIFAPNSGINVPVIVQSPMNSSIMKEKLDRHEYSHTMQFQADIELVFNNVTQACNHSNDTITLQISTELKELIKPILVKLESIDQMNSIPSQYALDVSALLTDEYLETLFDYKFEIPEDLAPPAALMELVQAPITSTNSMLSSAIERLDSVEPEEESEKEEEKKVEEIAKDRTISRADKGKEVVREVVQSIAPNFEPIKLPSLQPVIQVETQGDSVARREKQPLKIIKAVEKVMNLVEKKKETPKVTKKRRMDPVFLETPETPELTKFAPPRARRSATVVPPRDIETLKPLPKPKVRRQSFGSENGKSKANQAYIPPIASTSRRSGPAVAGASRTRQEYMILDDDKSSRFESGFVLPEGSSRRRSGGTGTPGSAVKKQKVFSYRESSVPLPRGRPPVNKEKPVTIPKPRIRKARTKPVEQELGMESEDTVMVDTNEESLPSGSESTLPATEGLSPDSNAIPPPFELADIPPPRSDDAIHNQIYIQGDRNSEMSDLTDLDEDEEKSRLALLYRNETSSVEMEASDSMMMGDITASNEDLEVEQELIGVHKPLVIESIDAEMIPVQPIEEEETGNIPEEVQLIVEEIESTVTSELEAAIPPVLDAILLETPIEPPPAIEEEFPPLKLEIAAELEEESNQELDLPVEEPVSAQEDVPIVDDLLEEVVEPEKELVESNSNSDEISAEMDGEQDADGVLDDSGLGETPEVDQQGQEKPIELVKPKGKVGKKKGRSRLNSDGLTFSEARSKFETRLKQLTLLVSIKTEDTLLDGDLVWAKLSGFPTFPAEVADPDDNTPGKLAKLGPTDPSKILVMFFDERRSAAWITKTELRHLGENLEIDEMLQSAMACIKSKTFKGGSGQAAGIQKAYKWAVSMAASTPPPDDDDDQDDDEGGIVAETSSIAEESLVVVTGN